MGDMSELKPLVVIGVFISTVLFFITLIPGDFVISGYDDYRNIEYSEYWDANLIQSYADFWNATFDAGSSEIWLTPNGSYSLYSQAIIDQDGEDFGGYDELWFLSNYDLVGTEGRIFIAYPMQRFWIFVTNWGYAEFYFPNRTSIDINSHMEGWSCFLNKHLMDEYYLQDDQNFTSFKVKMNYEGTQTVWFDLHFSFNTSLYGTPTFAWDAPDDINALTGIHFDQTRTSYEAWDIISALLFFNVPSVLSGTPAFIGYILSSICWIPIIYVTFIIILRSIGALFGGGA